MEIENLPRSNSIYKKFVFILLLMFSSIAVSVICLIIIAKGQNKYLFRLAFFTIVIALFVAGFLLLGVILNVVLLWRGHSVPRTFGKLLRLSLTIIYPGMLFFSKFLGYDKNTVRKVFIELNNKLTFVGEYNMKGNNILILIPHCIQKSFCPHRITVDIENCKRCGKCNIDGLIKLKEEFGVGIKVVTGGTLARKVVNDLKPKAVIAIACERDLINGLQDVKGFPVIAIINKRPEGPCMNTSVNIDEVRTAIKHFLGPKTKHGRMM